jgi:DNA-binding NarL/FixJ family response regulator
MKLKKSIVIFSQEVVALGLKHVLEAEIGFPETVCFLSTREAISYFAKGGAADLVLLEHGLQKKHGFDFFDQTRFFDHRHKTLIVSSGDYLSNVKLDQSKNSLGFLDINSSVEQMKFQIKSTIFGQKITHPVAPVATRNIEDRHFKKILNKYRLSSSEIRILEKFLEQKDYKQVADALFLSPQTIRTHKKNIYRKFGVRNMAGIVSLLAEDMS